MSSSDTTSPVIFREDEFEILNDPIEALPGDNGFTAPGLPGWMLPAGVVLLALFGLVPAAKALRRLVRRRRLAGGDVSAAWAEIVDLDGDTNVVEALPVDQRGGVNLRTRGTAPDGR